jgi:DNA-directed RNA polymerase subunit alpha
VIQKNWTELIKPGLLDINPGDDPSRLAKVVAEPLERGFGLTLGNALRRTLMSSLQGAAVTSVQIDGVLHEFSSIPGVREDVTDIILNVKALAVRMGGDLPKRMELKAKGPGEVTAAAIDTGHDIEILNPELVICALDKGASISIEMTVESGKGYLPAAQGRAEDAPIGLIPVDALFSPVSKVAYRVENTRVGQITDYDKLSMDIETDGTVTPEDAVALAARILQDQFQLFIIQQEPAAQGGGVGALGPLGQLSQERQHRLYRRSRAKDRIGDAPHPQFRAQVVERDQGSAGPYGPLSRHGYTRLAAGKHRGAGQAAG